MFACWSRAASWISRLNRSARDPSSELRGDDLDHDLAPERRLLGDEDARHAAAAELALDAVAVGERERETVERLGHAVAASWCWRVVMDGGKMRVMAGACQDRFDSSGTAGQVGLVPAD